MLYKDELIGLEACLRLKQPDSYMSGCESDHSMNGQYTEGGPGVYYGIVENFLKDKGYGFINSSHFEAKVFCHYSKIIKAGWKTLKKGQPVQFHIQMHEGKPQAHNVILLSNENLEPELAVSSMNYY